MVSDCFRVDLGCVGLGWFRVGLGWLGVGLGVDLVGGWYKVVYWFGVDSGWFRVGVGLVRVARVGLGLV